MNPPFSATRAILRKRKGMPHPEGEIDRLVRGFVDGSIADYQMTAWMMAVYFQGLDRRETTELTRSMLNSGGRLDRWGAGPPVVDKHSTGGVGDKVSIALAPLAAACDLRVPMISGRALGHTGGTLDKLESIPGYRTRIEAAEFRRIVEEVGCSIAGATEDIVPADRRMYALRDVSGTIESPPLIVSSIVSKKAAASLDGLVLDVKVGVGGFSPDRAAARSLALGLVQAASDMGMRTCAALTAMDDPLGRSVGNALEVREAIDILRGAGVSQAFREICVDLTASMLQIVGMEDLAAARCRVVKALDSGAALQRLARMVEAHGGDPRIVENPDAHLPRAHAIARAAAREDGWVESVDAREAGEIVIDAGGGRRRAADAVDPAVGLVFHVERGDRVRRGDILCDLHLPRGFDEAVCVARVLDAIRIGPVEPKRAPVVLDRVSAGDLSPA